MAHHISEGSGAQSELDRLVLRSNRLGADPAVVNWKGGNTSVKCLEQDVTGEAIRVLWVKASGTDLRTISAKGFAGLRLDPILKLQARDSMSDDAMVEYLLRCLIHPNFPRPSIETLLHAFIKHPHVDHTHPDAIIAFCTADHGEALMKEAFGDSAVWIPYIRPGFTLSKWVAEAVNGNPHVQAVFLAKHGLVTWGCTSDECYENTQRVIQQAATFIRQRSGTRVALGGLKVPGLTAEQLTQAVCEVAPVLRGAVSKQTRMLLYHDASEPVLAFTNSHHAPELSQRGSACPDHLVHTKYTPLFIDWNPGRDTLDELQAKIVAGCEQYAAEYRQYADTNKNPGDPTVDPYPRIILIPGLGMFSTGKDAELAYQAGGLYHRAIAVMQGAETLGRFQSMSPKEAYDVEYWPLELYKLTLAPPEQLLSRRVALVTGGAGGIGRATGQHLASLGAHVVLADINEAGAQQVAENLCRQYGERRATAVRMDVTDEQAVRAGFAHAVRTYGGVDIVVSNAGMALASPIEETTVAEWDLLHNVLVKGYFLVAREAFRVWKQQGLGGSLIFVTSKNGLVASRGAAAYNAAKAAEQHLARTLAEEGGPFGIRVNCVAPDAVLEGSGIWNSRWREARARGYGIQPEELEAFYRSRTTLRVNVYPQDVAEAIAFLASDRSAKTTGCTITVDGGVAAAYTR